MLRSLFVRMSSRGSEPMERISWRRCTELEEGDRWIAPPPPNRPAWATAAKEARRAKGLKNIMVLVSGGCQTATRTRKVFKVDPIWRSSSRKSLSIHRKGSQNARFTSFFVVRRQPRPSSICRCSQTAPRPSPVHIIETRPPFFTY